MTLRELVEPIASVDVRGDAQATVSDVTDDSRQVRAGSVFVAIRGEHVDGHQLVDHVWEHGAVGVVVDERDGAAIAQRYADRAVVVVPDTRRALGVLAGRMHNDPSLRLRMVGITGTNGKTTVAHLVRALVEGAGGCPGVLGTVGYFIGNEASTASHTTPGAVQLQTLLQDMVEHGVETAILEVSSHALALDRVAGCEFDIAAFTNLTQDHLDFHGDMDAYGKAKQRLFTEYLQPGRKAGAKRAIINADDPWGAAMVRGASASVWTYGIDQPADIRAADVTCTITGTTFRLSTPKGVNEVRSQLVGEHNVYNLLAAVGVGLELGMVQADIVEILSHVRNVPGRFERIQEGQNFTVIVDYAHTEDALHRVLNAIDTVKHARVLTVFGCGGDRDRGKRPKMGQVAIEQSDVVFITSDNPRTEDPLSIVDEIERGILESSYRAQATYRKIPDRREAIEAAVNAACPDDIVLIAGKGHEDYQIVGSDRLDFDDRRVAGDAIRRRLAASSATDTSCPP